MKHFFIPSVKQIIFLLLSLSLALFVMVVAFSSCSPNNQTNEDSTVGNTDGDDTGSNRRTTNNDRCTDDVGDKCKGNESCEQVCESIYEEWDAQRSCMDRGDETVGKLQKIHNRLMGKKAAGFDGGPKVWDALKEITDEEDGVGRDDFKCYLQIGVDKYIDEIKKGLNGSDGSNKRSNLLAVLEWFVKGDKEAGEVLSELSAGDDILEALLLALAGKGDVDGPPQNANKDCITGSDYEPTTTTCASDTQNPRRNNWYLDLDNSNSKELNVCISSTESRKIQLDSDDKKLYQALSCFHPEDNINDNIFSYSAEEENEHIFELAFELLNGICNNIKSSKDNGQDKACARALMCWTAWQNQCTTRSKGCEGNPNQDNDLWDSAKEHSSSLQKSSGSDYDKCRVEDFADFF